MNWKTFWDQTALTATDTQSQVGRIIAGKPISKAQEVNLANRIVELLQLKPTDTLIDVCCGNGWLTEKIACYCESAIGVDQSAILIKNAKLIETNKLRFGLGSAEELSSIANIKADKILLYFSFQYFESYELGYKVVSEMIKCLKPGSIILIGDITDAEKKAVFYITFKKRLLLFIQTLRGKNQMGKFWHKRELLSICKKLNVQGEALTQPDSLPYSHYRFDFKISSIIDNKV